MGLFTGWFSKPEQEVSSEGFAKWVDCVEDTGCCRQTCAKNEACAIQQDLDDEYYAHSLTLSQLENCNQRVYELQQDNARLYDKITELEKLREDNRALKENREFLIFEKQEMMFKLVELEENNENLKKNLSDLENQLFTAHKDIATNQERLVNCAVELARIKHLPDANPVRIINGVTVSGG